MEEDLSSQAKKYRRVGVSDLYSGDHELLVHFSLKFEKLPPTTTPKRQFVAVHSNKGSPISIDQLKKYTNAMRGNRHLLQPSIVQFTTHKGNDLGRNCPTNVIQHCAQ